MFIRRIKSEGLAHNSYFIGSAGGAAVIDPRRDIDVYINLALENGLKIDSIFETHRNEDYVTGSVDLAKLSGAPIYHGPGLDWRFGSLVKDEQEFRIGRLTLQAIQTPGHTPESLSYILIDRDTGTLPVGVFCGDALFVGSTGRVDICGTEASPAMAGQLWDSLVRRLLPLGDGVMLYPAHGAGSLCGVNIADRDESTLGLEKRDNPDLQFRDESSFVQYKLAEEHQTPPYFAQMETYNRFGPPSLGRLSRPPELPALDFKKHIENGAVVIDTALPNAFAGAHIKGAYSVWLDGLPGFSGWFLDYDKPVILVLEDSDHLEKARLYLYRLGYDRIEGFLKGGIEGWYNAGLPIEGLPLLPVHELKQKIDRGEDLFLLDVRRPQEWRSGHIRGAVNIYVGQIEKRLSEIPRDKPVVVYCTVGHRAGIAASILLRAGFKNVFNLPGSITAWRHAGYPLTQE